MKTIHQSYKWAIRWRSKNKIDGETDMLMGGPIVFDTRREAREYIGKRWGYIRVRKDLRREPFGWRVPQAVKVQVSYKVVE